MSPVGLRLPEIPEEEENEADEEEEQQICSPMKRIHGKFFLYLHYTVLTCLRLSARATINMNDSQMSEAALEEVSILSSIYCREGEFRLIQQSGKLANFNSQ